MPTYSREPPDVREFTAAFDRFYTRFAPTYDFLVKLVPLWKRWLNRALPHIKGPRVLEVSFGTGYLITQLAGTFETHGIDLNARMVETARGNLRRAGLEAHLCRGTVEALPYRDASFDTVLCTMAFSGYPDAQKALAEMLRVLRSDGRLVIVDVNYPAGGNPIGQWVTELCKRAGDLVRDMGGLFRAFALRYSDEEIGAFGSVHLYVALKGAPADNATPTGAAARR